jgi:DNA invertase Pin-like site-specific DNA recombinase
MTTKSNEARGAKLAYSYRRFSSRHQGDGSSLARQLEMAQDVCTSNGWQLVDLPADEGVSAYKVNGDGLMAANMHRGNLGAFLERTQAGQIKRGSVLIIEKLDRFSRNYYDVVFPVWLNLLQSGIEIYSCVSRTHYTLDIIRKNPMLAGMALIEMANANEYSSGMSSRINKAFSLRLAECAKGQKMNLGGWQPRWVDFNGNKGESGEFTLNAHADTVRRIVGEYIGGASMCAIARGLLGDKVPNLRGGKWGQGTVGHLLQSELLLGHVTIKGVRLERYYPAVITDAQYSQLRAKLAENVARKGGSPKSDYIASLFRNRCRCAKCGGTVTSSSTYYYCRGKAMHTCDAYGTITIRALEMDFFMLFLQEHPAVLLGKQTVKGNGTVAALKARIRDLDKAIEDATSLVGKLPIKALEAKLTALVKERDQAAREIENANLKMLSAASAPTALESIKKTLSAFTKLAGDYAGTKQEARLVKAIELLRRQLGDNETRKKLLNLLPTLVNQLVLDIEHKRYRIVNHVGEVSGWRQLAR